MTNFRLVIQPEAERNIAIIQDWIAEQSPSGAQRWYLALKKALDSLKSHPERFPTAPESRHFDVDIQDAVFKTRRGLPYRILFTVREAEVQVLFVRGPGQDWAREPN